MSTHGTPFVYLSFKVSVLARGGTVNTLAKEGEELYFDYGDRYWEDRTASGAACKVLSDEDLEAFKLKEKMYKHNICTLNTMRSVMY